MTVTKKEEVSVKIDQTAKTAAMITQLVQETDGADLDQVIEALQREAKAEKQMVSVNTTLDVPPWDGAIALTDAIKEILGVVHQKNIMGFFGPEPAASIEVEVELGKTITIGWGQFELPGMGKGAVAQTDVNRNSDGLLVFDIQIVCTRKYRTAAQRILDRARAIAMEKSIHKGKAFSIEFLDRNKKPIAIPTPKFFPISDQKPIFRMALERAIERNVFVPLREHETLLKRGKSLKRGVLFAGQYGTGKTMLASYIANVATVQPTKPEDKWTFIYVRNAEELPYALRYAQRYGKVVVFCEDVDRIAGIDRTEQVNALLNQLDGIDSKSSAIFTVLTSNHPESINPAMRRPGRIDTVLEVPAPDAEAVARMIRFYAGARLEAKADLSKAGEILAGLSPAYVREAVNRAEYETLRRASLSGDNSELMTGDDLAEVAEEIKSERSLFVREEKIESDAVKALGEGLSRAGEAFLQVVNN